jgi:hypothetical protein
MSRITSNGLNSGLDTADIKGERRINGSGLGIFIAALIFFLLLFFTAAAYYTVYYDNSGARHEIRQPEGDNRAQP